MRDRKAAHARGVLAEQQCAAYLEGKGYAILGLRVRTKGGEIDIVAQHGDTLVIVEVKARKNAEDSLYSITPRKLRRLAQAANALLAEPGEIGGLGQGLVPNMRFDVMAVAPGCAPFHLENAWSMDDEI